MTTAGKLMATSAAGLALFWTLGVEAQVERSGGASAQLAQQYQQAISDRAQLQAENEKLKKSLDDLKKQFDGSQQQLNAAKAGTSRGQAALAAAQASNESNAKALADSKSKMQELIGHFREMAGTLRGLETERTQLQQQLAQSKAAYDKCAGHNADLYQIANEVLDRYQHQGMLSYLERSEPFTRLKKTQIDNAALDYRQRAEELRVKPAAGAETAAPSASSPPAAPPGVVPAPAASPESPAPHNP
jgi:chromosome segregation ATPase